MHLLRTQGKWVLGTTSGNVSRCIKKRDQVARRRRIMHPPVGITFVLLDRTPLLVNRHLSLLVPKKLEVSLCKQMLSLSTEVSYDVE
jgi:hypothetical protein